MVDGGTKEGKRGRGMQTGLKGAGGGKLIEEDEEAVTFVLAGRQASAGVVSWAHGSAW